MPDLAQLARFLLPYQWQPLIALACATALLTYGRGLAAGAKASVGRTAAMFTGVGLIYFVTQTRFDYYSQFLFFAHRGQHLVLHHLGAMLIALANPIPVMAHGVPLALRTQVLRPLWRSTVTQSIYRFIQYPAIAGVLFVGVIYFWLIPAIHFDAMLNRTWYNVMNWSMALDGILFWWLIFNPASPQAHGLGYGKRCLLLALVAFPQILLGAYITLSGAELYGIYALCGRPWPIAAQTDQLLGGLITWIPSAMMSAVGVVIVLWRWRRYENQRLPVSADPLSHA